MDNSTQTTQQVSLYKRMGGEQVIRPLVNDLLDQNARNPVIAHHFKNVDMDKLKQRVFEFFSYGTGGPHTYTGNDMRTAHQELNITEKEWQSSTDDAIWAMDKHGIGKAEQEEVLNIFESLKADVMGY